MLVKIKCLKWISCAHHRQLTFKQWLSVLKIAVLKTSSWQTINLSFLCVHPHRSAQVNLVTDRCNPLRVKYQNRTRSTYSITVIITTMEDPIWIQRITTNLKRILQGERSEGKTILIVLMQLEIYRRSISYRRVSIITVTHHRCRSSLPYLCSIYSLIRVLIVFIHIILRLITVLVLLKQ